MAQALIGLGSNIEPRRDYLRLAIDELGKAPLTLLRQSQVYETEAMDVVDQADFLNMAALVETKLEPLELLGALKAIEAKAGKHVVIRWGPRSLDLDLWALGERVHEDAELSLPHPRIADRPFVLIPLAEIAPQWRHPQTGMDAATMLGRIPKPWPVVKLLGPL